MSIANYGEMVTAVESWLNRSGFPNLASQIPDFIAFGQRRIMYDMDLNAMEEVDAAFTIDAQTKATPADLLRVKSLTIIQANATQELLGAPIAEVTSFATPTMPITFAIIGANFYFGPTPDQAYTATLHYYKALPILSSVNTTNWFTEKYPELLLAASLVEALLWLKDDNRAQIWDGQYRRYMDALMTSENRMDKPYGTMKARLK